VSSRFDKPSEGVKAARCMSSRSVSRGSETGGRWGVAIALVIDRDYCVDYNTLIVHDV